MTRRNIVLAILVLIVLIGGAYFVFGGSLSSSVPHTVIETGDRQHKESSDYYLIQINYPDKTPLATRGGWGAEARAQSATDDMIRSLVRQFKESSNVDNLSQEEKDRLNKNGLKYSLNVGYKPYSSGSFVSYEYDVFMDTGGAHPNNFYRTLVFNLNGDTVKLGDLFKPDSNYLERIASSSKAQIEAQIKQRAGSEAVDTLIADGFSAKEENFQSFVVDSDRLRIFIPPYQAAAYAAGAFEVQIPLVDVKDILKPNVN
jgi:hypothetical protein